MCDFDWVFGRKYALFRGGCQISTSGGPHKIDQKKNFFLFCLLKCFPIIRSYPQSNPTVTGFSKLKRKSLCRSVILTGSFGCKYAFFEDIWTFGVLNVREKINIFQKKKNCIKIQYGRSSVPILSSMRHTEVVLQKNKP